MCRHSNSLFNPKICIQVEFWEKFRKCTKFRTKILCHSETILRSPSFSSAVEILKSHIHNPVSLPPVYDVPGGSILHSHWYRLWSPTALIWITALPLPRFMSLSKLLCLTKGIFLTYKIDIVIPLPESVWGSMRHFIRRV